MKIKDKLRNGSFLKDLSWKKVEFYPNLSSFPINRFSLTPRKPEYIKFIYGQMKMKLLLPFNSSMRMKINEKLKVFNPSKSHQQSNPLSSP